MIEDPDKIAQAYEEGRIRKVLCVRNARLGDLVFTTAALRRLKARFPRADIHFLTNPYSQGVLEGNPHVAKIHLLDRKHPLWRFFRMAPGAVGALRRERFDLAVPFRWRGEYAGLFRRIGVPRLFRPGAVQPEEGRAHLADILVQALAPLGVQPDEGGLEIFPSAEDRAWVDEFLAACGRHACAGVILHAGCHQVLKFRSLSEPAKRTWPAGHWADLASLVKERFGAAPILTGYSASDRALNRIIMQRSGVDCPQCLGVPPRRLAALMERASGFVCMDTGRLHVASAAGAPTVALFGPSRPVLTGPYRNARGAVTLHKNIPCAPCKGNDTRCKNNVCMQLITPLEVIEALQDLAGRTERADKAAEEPAPAENAPGRKDAIPFTDKS
jgi:ADP-heptose:LPS heptosyltransferase